MASKDATSQEAPVNYRLPPVHRAVRGVGPRRYRERDRRTLKLLEQIE